MRSYDKTYTITEYGGFTCGKELCGYQKLPERTFNALENFILANNAGKETEAIELLSLSARRGAGKVITARNYVGLITINDGTVIEILPKIAGAGVSPADTKRIFLDMLKTLRDATFKDFNVSNLYTDRLSVFEIFIKMFLDEVTILTKQGLKSAYVSVEDNERFYKGKLLTTQNLKCNLVNKAQIFVRYDDFSLNRAENRLIKSTLKFLLNATNDSRNRQNVVKLLTFFDNVEFSQNFDTDFSSCAIDRGMKHYNKTLSWCRVFLRGNSLTAFAGSEVAVALLFPMEKVFESFIAAKVHKHIGNGVSLRIQDAKYSLFDCPPKTFNLRPDIVLANGSETVVIDTKWKMLSKNARNYGISQSDMYQMYAYGKKYNAKKVILLYPQSDNLLGADISFQSDDGVNVEVLFIDLLQSDMCVESLIQGAVGESV